MQEIPRYDQEPLFDIGPEVPFTHFFYLTYIVFAQTRVTLIKTGYSKDVERRMAREQFKGHSLFIKTSCNCTPRIVLGKKKCDMEIKWENAHAVDRQPASELFELSADIYTAMRFMGGKERRAMAILDHLRRNGMREAG